MTPNESIADLDAKAQKLHHQGYYVEAEPLYRQSLMLREQQFGTVHPFLVNNMNRLAFVLSELGNYTDAIVFSERTLNIIEQQLGSEHIEYGKGLGNLGVLLAERGSHSGAETALRQCCAILEKKLSPKHPNVTKSLLNLAGLLYKRGSYTEAEHLFRSNILILGQQLGAEHFDLAEPLNNLAGCLCMLGNYADAEPLYQRSLVIREKHLGQGHPDVAHVLNNLATFYAYLGNYFKAEQFYQRSLIILEECLGEDNLTFADALGNLANLYNSNGEHAKAEPLLRRYLSVLIQFFGPKSIAVAKNLRNLASCLSRLDKLDEAEKLSRKSLSIMKKRLGPDNAEVAISQINLANILKDSVYHFEVESLYRRSLGTLEQQLGPEHPEIARNLMSLARHFDKTKRTTSAIFCAKKAINIFQKVRENVSNLGETNLQFLDTSLENIYSFLADLLIKTGRYSEAEYVMGMLKDRELFELLRRDIQCDLSIKSIAWNSAEAPQISRFDEITSNLNIIGKQIDGIKQLKNRLLQQNSELAALEEKLYARYGELSEFIENLEDELPTSSTDDIENGSFKIIDLTSVAPNIAAVIPIAAENTFTTLLVTAHARKAFSSEHNVVDLAKKILEFREFLKDADSYEFLTLAKELYNIIIRPIENHLNANGIDTILWMLNGALRLLPISTLHDGKQFVLEKFSNVCISTISDNEALKHESWNALGMGRTQEDDTHQALPAVKEELEGIICKDNSTGILPGTILLDDFFTLENMQAHLSQGYKVAHFASHFELNPANETMSYLLLGDGSKLRMDKFREFGELFKGMDLVTFSACSTGLGTTGAKGREVDGIGYMGELQGARAVLATLWKVHDSSTSILMREFYRNRESGNSKAKALQKVQLAMLNGALISEEGHDFTHPFFWSPFILIGNGD